MKKYIKSIFSVAAAALIGLSLSASVFAQTADPVGTKAVSSQTAAEAKESENKENTTYIFWDSSKGDDKADGSAADKAVKSLEKVLSIINKDDSKKDDSNKDDSNKAVAIEQNSKSTGDAAKVKAGETVKFVVVKCASADLTAKESEFISKNKINVITSSEYEIIINAEKEAAKEDSSKEETADSTKEEEKTDDTGETKSESSEAKDEGTAAGDNAVTDEKDGTTQNDGASNEDADKSSEDADKNGAASEENTEDKSGNIDKDNTASTENAENSEKIGATDNSTQSDQDTSANEATANATSNKMAFKGLKMMSAKINFTVIGNNTETEAAGNDEEASALALASEEDTKTAEVDSGDTQEDLRTADTQAISLLALPGRDLVGGGTQPIKDSDSKDKTSSATSTNGNTTTATAGTGSSNSGSGSENSGKSTGTASAAAGKNLQLAGGKSTSNKTGAVNTGDTTDIVSIAVVCSLAAASSIILAVRRTKKHN